MESVDNKELKKLFDQMTAEVNQKIDEFGKFFADQYYQLVKNSVNKLIGGSNTPEKQVEPSKIEPLKVVPPPIIKQPSPSGIGPGKFKISGNFGSQFETRLPWFKHRIKGVLNELWYGDHSMWTQEGLSLYRFSMISEEVKKTGDLLINEMSPSPELVQTPTTLLQPMFDKLKQDLSKTVFGYFVKATQLYRHVDSSESEAIPEPSEEQKSLNDISKKWWKTTGLDNDKKTEVMKWLTNDLRRNQEAHLRIKKKYVKDAVDFMTDHGLDYKNPFDVRKVWPRHIKEPLAEPPRSTRPDPDGAAFDNDPIINKIYKRKKEDRDRDAEEPTLFPAEAVLENATLEARKLYYVYKLRAGY